MSDRTPYIFIGGTSEPGGLHVHTVDVALAVAAAGHPVTLVCPSIDYYSAMVAGTGIRVVRIEPRKSGERVFGYWRKHLAAHRGARAVFCRGQLAESSIGDLFGIRSAVRRLYTIEHRALVEPEIRRAALRRHGLAMRLLVRRLIAVSGEIAEHARRILNLPPARIATCLNWVDPTFRPVTPQQRSEAKRALGFANTDLVVGYHGRLAPEKRLPALIESMARIPAQIGGRTVCLALAGEGWKRAELQALIRQRGLATRATITGWHPDPRAAMAAFDIAVLPSLSEGFPLGLLESMATGLPCLAHPMSSTERLIATGRNGILADLSDSAHFDRALVSLLELSDTARNTLGSAAADSIQRDFSRERRLPDVLAALDVAAGAAPPIRPRNLEFIR